MTTCTAFIGGGNMATAILGGMIRSGTPGTQIMVVEPDGAGRARLEQQYGVRTLAQPSSDLRDASLVIWAIKPQVFREAATQCAAFVGEAVQLSVAAGITTASISAWLQNSRIVRAMPNTPALIGHGMTALFASSAVSPPALSEVETILRPTGDLLWVERESDLDAVTALSGSGPAYVFFFLESMRDAGVEMGLSPEQSYRLALSTFAGATALAKGSNEPAEVLRERVTSKGGTTYAALSVMLNSGMQASFRKALLAAQARAEQLGKEFGGMPA